MIVQHEVILGTMVGYSLRHFHRRLVVSVKEIHLKALDSHVRIFLASLVKMFVKNVEHRPQHNIHALLLAVGNQFGKVDVGNRIHDVALTGIVPSLIEYDVFKMVLGGKVDVILIGGNIDACFEVDTPQIPVVPPIPSHFAWLNPRRIAYLVGFGK